MTYSLKLKNCSKITDSASDGQQAFDKVMENVKANGNLRCTYDLILMDCNMPFMDGYESSKRIRSYLFSLNIHQPIILAVTGHTEPSYVERAVKSGMNSVLSKPI